MRAIRAVWSDTRVQYARFSGLLNYQKDLLRDVLHERQNFKFLGVMIEVKVCDV